ncbi:endolysin [Caulobacter virus Karma]|uniref:Lysozyme n=6 Tax=Viruses TaxID=10239 RepID=J3SVU8_9CAUD|nr:endolysin [Caulobacter phage phiCbK]YP_006989485.1 endolysin [Caulobacter virus Karma]YP_006989833.1 endolysin [Caulobacter phage CcrSwift]ARB15019.1 lysozyme [Caulobacter phage Ccr32]ARB15351.1 lysozyme [Caulobacter phage Ccr34]AFO71731.1 phage lysozyme [Caulobacter phage phiCbK]AFU86936.1 putative endolysin [Caulobacter phage phiCbK]AFU87622.1 putative endolysin [Caulobacter virus Karma]
MRVSDTGLKLIQAWEGLGDGNPATVDLEPYVCPAKVWTVGWGHALKTPTGQIIDVDVFGAARAKVLAAESMQRKFGKGAITRDQAVALLREDVTGFERSVDKMIGAAGATQAQFDALVSFAFNCGSANLQSSTLLRLHNAGKRAVGDVSMSALCKESKLSTPIGNIAVAFSRWNKVNKVWALGLFRRRLSEVLVYGGHNPDEAVKAAQGFKGC